jgi:hypothetical protein
MRIKRPWTTLVGLLAGTAAVLWAVSYHPRLEFKGGKGMRDSGFFSYPRFHAQLGDVPLWKTGEYRFMVRGLPSGSLDLKLQVSGGGNSESAELASLTTVLSISIADESGKDVCAVSGRLSDAQIRGLGSWVLESSSSQASFWSPRCQHLNISRFKAYTTKITVADVDPHSPQLEGGGIELP